MSLGMPGSQGSGAGWQRGSCWQCCACSNMYSKVCNPWQWTNGAVGSNHCIGQDGKSGIHQRFNSQDSLCLMGQCGQKVGEVMSLIRVNGDNKIIGTYLLPVLLKNKSLCDCTLKLSLQPD